MKFLVNGFRNGFKLGYTGPTNRQDTSNNIPLKVGNKYDVWEKIIKEVKCKRYAGPFERIPYKNFVQSPIGLVPKAGGKTHLIFHLSYNFKDGSLGHKSINFYTPEKDCRVKYKDLDYAVQTCFNWCEPGECYLSKTDVQSAFRLVPLSPDQYYLLILKAENPLDGKTYFFADKNLPFGSSISCSHFQRFSNAVRHVLEFQTQRTFAVTNYLDDFLFVEKTRMKCNQLVRTFLTICEYLGIPIAEEKTVWACDELIFLGILLDGKTFRMIVPEEKRIRALNICQMLLHKRTVTIRDLQSFVGLLNFLNRDGKYIPNANVKTLASRDFGQGVQTGL